MSKEEFQRLVVWLITKGALLVTTIVFVFAYMAISIMTN